MMWIQRVLLDFPHLGMLKKAIVPWVETDSDCKLEEFEGNQCKKTLWCRHDALEELFLLTIVLLFREENKSKKV